MSTPNIPPALREEFNQIQQLEETLRKIDQYTQITQNAVMEIKKSIQDLSEVEDDAVVYKSVGSILIQSEKAKMEETLKDDLSTQEMHLKRYQNQQTETKKKLDEMRKKFMDKFQQLQS
jgi:prefoldin beta subunit